MVFSDAWVGGQGQEGHLCRARVNFSHKYVTFNQLFSSCHNVHLLVLLDLLYITYVYLIKFQLAGVCLLLKDEQSQHAQSPIGLAGQDQLARLTLSRGWISARI